MTRLVATALLLILAGCAHVSAPAGWDCRASVERDGIRADGWLHLSPAGRVGFTRAEWWQQGLTSPLLRFGTAWDGAALPLDWDSGRVELILALAPASPGQAHRLELHGGGRRLLHGGFDRRPNLLLTGPYATFREAAATAAPALIVVSSAGTEVARRPFDSTTFQRGAAIAAEAFAAARRKSSDYRRLCERAPEIIVT